MKSHKINCVPKVTQTKRCFMRHSGLGQEPGKSALSTKCQELHEYDLERRRLCSSNSRRKQSSAARHGQWHHHQPQQRAHWWSRQTAGTEHPAYVCTLTGPTQKTLASYQPQHQAPAASRSWRLLFLFSSRCFCSPRAGGLTPVSRCQTLCVKTQKKW